jgi:hypothetical protein
MVGSGVFEGAQSDDGDIPKEVLFTLGVQLTNKEYQIPNKIPISNNRRCGET